MASPENPSPDTMPIVPYKADPNTDEAIAAERDLLDAIQAFYSQVLEDNGIAEEVRQVLRAEHLETEAVFEEENPMYVGLFEPKFESSDGEPATMTLCLVPTTVPNQEEAIMVPAVKLVTHEPTLDGLPSEDYRMPTSQGGVVRLLEPDKNGDLKPAAGFTESHLDAAHAILQDIDRCREANSVWVSELDVAVLPHLKEDLSGIR
ncbi:MAG: hypothetical protein AAB436_03830 [Patescibacteria group bacterium]